MPPRSGPLALLIALAIPASAHAAGPWFVAKTGNNANTCLDAAHACLSISAAVTKASAGDTINIGAGTYAEGISTNKAPVFVGAGEGPGGTIVNSTGIASNAFDLTQGGTLRHLHVISQSGATINAGAASGVRTTTLESVIVDATGLQSPIDAGTSAGAFMTVQITDSALHAMAPGPGGSPDGAQFEDAVTAIVTRSTITATTDTALSVSNGASLTVNDSTAAGTWGISGSNGPLTVRRSTITGNGGRGIEYGGYSGVGVAPSARIDDSLVIGTTGGLLLTSEISTRAASLTARNSTFAVTSATGDAAGVGVATTATGHATVTLDGSIAHLDAPGATRNDIEIDGADASLSSSFSAFQSVRTLNGGAAPAAAAIAGDPMLNANYTLGDASPCIDHGDQAGLDPGEQALNGDRVLDGDGDGTAVVDVGAYEHPTVQPPVPSGGNPPPPPTVKDTTAPVLTKVSLKGRRLRFTLSEAATVRVKIKRRGAKKARVVKLTGKAGKNSARLPKFHAGRYTITLRATDAAGNASKTFTKRLKR